MERALTARPAPIAGVELHALRTVADERGAVLHMLRADSTGFARFGEVYFSEVLPGVVKAWKRHSRMTQRLCVPVGRVKFVIYDDRPDSATRARIEEYVLGRPDSYALLIIPPLLWYGFQGVAPSPSLVANCPDLPHDPAESQRRSVSDGEVPYVW